MQGPRTIRLVNILVILITISVPISAKAEIGDPPSSEYIVQFHPDGGLYSGDQVSIQVLAPPGTDMTDQSLMVSVDQPVNADLGKANFYLGGFENRYQAVLIWAWDTTHLASGIFNLTFKVDPKGTTWRQSVTLQAAKSGTEQWKVTQNACCIIHYISGSAAERDIEYIKTMVDIQAEDVSDRLHAQFNTPINIEVMPRLIGHGGFTTNQIYISYLDRNPASDQTALVVHHEMVHMLDNQIGGKLRPTILVEGLAVYLTGGHFKPEPLLSHASVLLDLDLYLPLKELADHFYASQHEIGYLEAGALIAYLVNTWGWEPFLEFYRDIEPAANGSQSEAISTGLEKHFGLSLVQLEDRYINYLTRLPENPDLREDVRLTVYFYDTLRRYQMILDPSAYFREAWLPDAQQMQERNIVADYDRHPDTLINQTLELILIGTRDNLLTGRFTLVERSLQAVNGMLDTLQKRTGSLIPNSPSAEDIFETVEMLNLCGMEAQHLLLNQNTGQATVVITWPDLIHVQLVKIDDTWQTQPICQPVTP
jgi:hypothetical protein